MPLNKGGKKVLFVITKGNFGGAQRYVYDIAIGLPKDKFEPVVACGNKEGDLLVRKLQEKNIRTIVLESSEREIDVKKDIKSLKNLIALIKDESPEVAHFNSSKIGFLGALAVLILKFKGLKTKAIFTSHGWAFNEKNRSAFSKFIFYTAHYFTVLVCDATIAVSEKTARDIVWLPFIKNKIKIIYNGIESFETLEKNEARDFIASEQGGRIIIFSTSELNNNKGIDVALKALSSLPAEARSKIFYSIAGSGEDKADLEKMQEEMHIKDCVKFLGFVDDARKYLSGADIFLLPSRTENLPFSVLEAGMAGLPVIATNVGGVSEIITDMKDGILVHKENPKEIAEAIKYLLNNPNKKDEFGRALRQRVVKVFSIEKMLKQTVKLY